VENPAKKLCMRASLLQHHPDFHEPAHLISQKRKNYPLVPPRLRAFTNAALYNLKRHCVD
jgi:hypothetical protein